MWGCLLLLLLWGFLRWGFNFHNINNYLYCFHVQRGFMYDFIYIFYTVQTAIRIMVQLSLALIFFSHFSLNFHGVGGYLYSHFALLAFLLYFYLYLYIFHIVCWAWFCVDVGSFGRGVGGRDITFIILIWVNLQRGFT